MKKYLFLLLLLLMLFSLFFNFYSNKFIEGIIPQRQLDIHSITSDSSFDPTTKMRMISIMNIADGRYRDIIYSRESDADKVKKLYDLASKS